MGIGKGLLTVRDVTAKLEGAPVSGSAEAKLTAPYTYEGKLELAKGDLASLQRLAPAVRPPLAVAGQFGITAAVNGTLSPFTAKVVRQRNRKGREGREGERRKASASAGRWPTTP